MCHYWDFCHSRLLKWRSKISPRYKSESTIIRSRKFQILNESTVYAAVANAFLFCPVCQATSSVRTVLIVQERRFIFWGAALWLCLCKSAHTTQSHYLNMYSSSLRIFPKILGPGSTIFDLPSFSRPPRKPTSISKGLI
jgi:hypothetical protein